MLVARLWACIQTRSITESHCELQGRAQLVCELSGVFFFFFLRKLDFGVFIRDDCPGTEPELTRRPLWICFLLFLWFSLCVLETEEMVRNPSLHHLYCLGTHPETKSNNNKRDGPIYQRLLTLSQKTFVFLLAVCDFKHIVHPSKNHLLTLILFEYFLFLSGTQKEISSNMSQCFESMVQNKGPQQPIETHWFKIFIK